MKIVLHLSLIFVLITLFSFSAQSQVLFTESFNVILDSSKHIKGSIMPNFKFQTQKENLLEFENLADITLKIKKNALTFANKIEISRFGSDAFLSGGYLYLEYRRFTESDKLVFEPYAQLHWAEARGMERKYAAGINLRYRILVNDKIGIYAGAGPFYEFERWNYQGVSEEIILPIDTTPITNQFAKLGSYVSCKINATDKLFFDFSAYHQAKFDMLFTSPRLATSSLARIELTRYLGFNVMHQFIYDYKPIMPIRKDFHRIIVGFSVNL